MKRIILMLFLAVTVTAYSQPKPARLSWVNTVKPVNGKKMAFEKAYKQHVAKYHKEAKISVFEILTGKWSGYYHVISNSTYADMDKEREDANAHGVDLDEKFNAYLEDDQMSDVYFWMDSLSFHSDMQADKFIVNVYHMNPGKQGDYRAEQKRSVRILNQLEGKFWESLSFNMYGMDFDGSDQVMVSVRGLPDGFASQENGYYSPGTKEGTPTFKEQYIKDYGTLDYEKRQKLLDEAFASVDVYIMKLRKDLSSE